MDTPASRTPPLYRLFPASCFLCHVMPCFATPLTSRTTLLLLLLLLLILFLLLTPVLPFHYCEIGPGRARCDAMRCDAMRCAHCHDRDPWAAFCLLRALPGQHRLWLLHTTDWAVLLLLYYRMPSPSFPHATNVALLSLLSVLPHTTHEMTQSTGHLQQAHYCAIVLITAILAHPSDRDGTRNSLSLSVCVSPSLPSPPLLPSSSPGVAVASSRVETDRSSRDLIHVARDTSIKPPPSVVEHGTRWCSLVELLPPLLASPVRREAALCPPTVILMSHHGSPSGTRA